ncbi:alpha-L-fucosidase [Niameybacter massiliensis]|uniref:alpha-L-fucosidase n=1 Tax=Holtiella tumoricola TaxID=3018743 RepID=A0AA42DQM9_9FIRM|nr:alpha-L-fucosidase [Holtiella tumoricola]MDA3733574.1 alpha-L-fucosidase [Holtiella tumoricola]
MATPMPLKRIADFEDLGFGMFVHWGLYSQVGKGEWYQSFYQVPKEKYEELVKTFAVRPYYAEDMVKVAKASGMKYIVLTTRHHDGFSLFDTKGLNTYDAPHAIGRDLVREYVDACNKYDIIPFFYHTTLDWHEESFDKDFKAYLKYLRDSVEILCSEYGKIGGLWFDGNWSKPNEDWEEDALYEVIRKHQPDAIIVNNTGLSHRGEKGNLEIDSVTFEQGRPTRMNQDGARKYLATEMCQTLNDHWGVGAHDFNYKSVPEIIETLCYSRRMGANYLLNIGLEPDGTVPEIQGAMLKLVGQWIELEGEAIYKGRPCDDISGEGHDFVLRVDDHTLYAFIHGLKVTGDSNVVVGGSGSGLKNFIGLNQKIKSIEWVDNQESLRFIQNADERLMSLYATGFSYGMNTVVRVAKIVLE